MKQYDPWAINPEKERRMRTYRDLNKIEGQSEKSAALFHNMLVHLKGIEPPSDGGDYRWKTKNVAAIENHFNK